jgi:hypothetical protein
VRKISKQSYEVQTTFLQWIGVQGSFSKSRIWRAQGDDLRTFLDEFVVNSLQFEPPSPAV